jgi:hypothetical protein
LTSALWPQASHVAVTTQTPFSRMFAGVIGGLKLLRMASDWGDIILRLPAEG